MVDSQFRINCFPAEFMDAADVYPKYFYRKICFVAYDEYHQLATCLTGSTQVCALMMFINLYTKYLKNTYLINL